MLLEGARPASEDLQGTAAEGKLRRRQFLEEQLMKAKTVSENHDTKELYAVITKLAPKHKHRTVRIRNTDGTRLYAEAECEEIEDYFLKLFSQTDCSATVDSDSAHMAGKFPMSSMEVNAALKANKLGKSVPPTHGPAGAWIACSSLSNITEALAEIISGYINGEQDFETYAF